MADQIMETLTNEEHERLLLMSEHAIAPPLSPAAQAIINAAVVAGGGYGRATPVLHARLAAALQAVADQVVPKSEPPQRSDFSDLSVYQWAADVHAYDDATRRKILAIAAELKAQ